MKTTWRVILFIFIIVISACKASQVKNSNYDVLLTDITNSSKVMVIKYVFDLNKLNIDEAKKMVNVLPSVVKSNISLEEANKIKKELEDLKAVAEIKKN